MGNVWQETRCSQSCIQHISTGIFISILLVSFLRWSITLVLPSMWLLLQEPQGWRRRRERHLLQRPLHLQLGEPLRGQLPPGNSHLWSCQSSVTPPRQGPNPGQATEKGARHYAPTVWTATEEWLTAHSYSQLPRHQHVQEKACEREANRRGGAGKVHSRFPQDQDPREISREEVHVAGWPAEEVSPLSMEKGCKEGTHKRPRISLRVFLIMTFAAKSSF